MSAHGLAGEVGVIILAIPPDSMPARSGLQMNDIILAIDDKKTNDVSQLLLQVAAVKPGARLSVVRGSESVEVVLE
jgi:S1-C subfamily serine protease